MSSSGSAPRRLLGPAGIYTAANLANAAIPFLLLPVLTRRFTDEEYGTIATFQALIGVLAPLVGLNLAGAFAREYYDDRGAAIAGFAGTCLLLVLGSAAAVLAALLAFGTPLAALAQFPEEWLWTAVPVALGQWLALLALTSWQVLFRPAPYAAFQVSQVAANLGLTILLVVGLSMDWRGRVVPQIVVAGVWGAAGLLAVARSGQLRIEPCLDDARRALRFGLPLVPHALAGSVMAFADRFFLNRMEGLDATGVYTVGSQVAMLLMLLATSFNTAWTPWLYSRLKEADPAVNRRLVKFTYAYVVGFFALAAALGWAAPFVVSLLAGKDSWAQGSSRFVVWLAIARAFDALYFMTCNYLFYARATGRLAAAMISAAAVHLAANYVLIPMHGPVGSAEAAVISSAFLALLVWILAARAHPMPWRFWRAAP